VTWLLRLVVAVVLLTAGVATAIAALAVHELWWGLPVTTMLARTMRPAVACPAE
jgi:hypothetical protein